MITCCHNCDQRTVGCHATCAVYRSEKENHLRQKAKQAQQVKETHAFDSTRFRVLASIRKNTRNT